MATTITPTVHVRRDQSHLAWDRSIQPIATVSSGSVVEVDALEASNGQVRRDSRVQDMASVDFSRVDQVHGPIYVEGAEPGDSLEVELLDFQPAEWGWTASFPGFGLLQEDFTQPALRITQLGGTHGELIPGIRIPLAPFCGVVGVAPADDETHPTIPPDYFGGNMDTKHLTRGAKLYLPVSARGALFSMGDGHAAQGDGEVCGTAIETSMRATVRLSVRKDVHVTAPEFETAGPVGMATNTGPWYVTDGIGPDLMTAAREAVRRMIDYLGRAHGLSPIDAYMLCSVTVDLKISEIVDAPHWIVSAYCPLAIF